MTIVIIDDIGSYPSVKHTSARMQHWDALENKTVIRDSIDSLQRKLNGTTRHYESPHILKSELKKFINRRKSNDEKIKLLVEVIRINQL